MTTVGPNISQVSVIFQTSGPPKSFCVHNPTQFPTRLLSARSLQGMPSAMAPGQSWVAWPLAHPQGP